MIPLTVHNAPPTPFFFDGVPCRTHIVSKGWGSETWLVNDGEYCAKILQFETGKRFSLHYHIDKREMWYVISGVYDLTVLDRQGQSTTHRLASGSVYHVARGEPHQIVCIEGGSIFEVSTIHNDSDSYRIQKGD